ncbi:hypothetical protein RO3G_13707 [Rhizopus delemar RA 99-880]|uniref:Ndc10 domain-containing protein n=1 Tax=Rhizopus delemar (strain RA 99-880 / ATCC MYA-4621 / FGSC 9543 / NRRL 43880) TaxID=246409 RepID=I1CKL6_RHIO9|nr:hypothetical protein RO3G_13707 [Rhizopus delemar RA 99-880]|eukprot:EIE88996.1 hypothetical protein RO3G_13707 [Rhizopus delemar RA 99-880]
MSHDSNAGPSTRDNDIALPDAEHYEDMIRARLAMDKNTQMVIAENQTYRPKNTTAAYKSKQREWFEWCANKEKVADGTIVYDAKLAFFLKDYVLTRGNKFKKNADGSPAPLGRESVLAYVKAVVDLYHQQVEAGFNKHTMARGPIVKRFLDTHTKKEARRKRTEYEDRGKNTLNDGYTDQELLRINQYFLIQNNIFSLRNKVCFSMSHAMLMRSETALGTQLPDLFIMELKNQGPYTCFAIVATITFGKTNKDGKIQYGSALRHRDVEVCPHGAFAQYFFSLFHHQNLPFPNFSTRRDWYDTYLFPNTTGDGSITYSEQAKIYKQVLRYCGVHSSKLTHINRKSAINMVANEGVSGDQQRQVGRWGSDRMVGCYLSGLPVDAIKVLAGFTTRKGDYFINRGSIEPSEELRKMVFPWIEYWREKFYRKEVEDDIAGPNFLDLMDYLRTVFLQDSVVLKGKYPGSFIWSHSIFDTDIYKDYEERLSSAIAANDEKFKMSQHLEVLLPEVAAAMKTGFDSMNAMLNIVQSQNQLTLNAVKQLEAENRTMLADSFLQISNMLRQGDENTQIQQTSTILPSSSVPLSSIPSPSAANSRGLPSFKMSRSLISVTDVWREYSVGLAGKPSIKSMEEQYGADWRKVDNRTESRFFTRRLPLYKKIESLSNERGISCEEAAQFLEFRRVSDKLSINQMCKLVADNQI